MTDITFRTAETTDRDAILDLNIGAFGRRDEAEIVSRLEADGDALLQLVAVMETDIVGHILFYAIRIDGRIGAVGLGPMSVNPWAQRAGIGSGLVHYGLRHLQDGGVSLVFVLGHESYYPRFGFSEVAAAPFVAPWKGPQFMAVRLRHGPPTSGRLQFPTAFGV
jgi:putative acetyltransferase